MATLKVFPGWEPKSEAQAQALECEAEILCFGGAAGSLKTETLLVDAAQEYMYPWLRAIIMRRTFPELHKIITRSRELYSQASATYNEQKKEWKFPSGASIRFGYCERDDDVYQYQGDEFTYLGVDESTHHSEHQIRYLISRTRSTHPMWVRTRLATNPGNVGSRWHKHVFLGDVCPHCHPPVRVPGQIYHDSTWLTDKKKLEMSTSFIFGKVTDHSLLGSDYIRKLRTQQSSVADALLAGCWEQFEGQYYDIWNPETMVVPRASIGETWWWPFWVGADYGFSGSQAAAYLFTRSPEGVIYVLQEYCAEHEEVRLWSKNIADTFVSKIYSGHPIRMQAMWLSPDCWNDRGDYRALANQMNEVLDPYGVAWVKANNDRAGGAMLIYSLLQRGLLKIADSCRMLIETIPSRIHDEDEPEKVMKVIGDPLDDCYDACLSGDVTVATRRGSVPICEVTTADEVMTRLGWRRVLRSWQTRDAAETLVVHLSNGKTVTATAEHPFWVEGQGFVRCDTLRYGNILCVCKAKPLSTKALSFGVIRRAAISICGIITGLALEIASGASIVSIARCTRMLSGLYRRALKFITKTATLFTIPSTILNYSLALNTSGGTALTLSEWQQCVLKSRRSALLQKHGTDRTKDASGIDNTQSAPSLNERSRRRDVSNAVRNSWDGKARASSVPINANRNGAATKAWTMLRGIVSTAASALQRIGTIREGSAPVRVLRVITGKRAPVFNITVEDVPEFFANGVLVHNCRYGIYSYEEVAKKPMEEKMKEVMEKAPDETSMAIHMAKLRQEAAEETVPAFIGAGAQRRQTMARAAVRSTLKSRTRF